ncbi:MAG: hypothetical protein ABIP55_10000, partial [Tepidisphaeraceae bacterium]
HAGGSAPGEVGGGLWRSGDFGYYADRVGPLNLEQRLEARGKVKLITAGPDSDMLLGWFSSAGKSKEPAGAGNIVAIHVGGPTRIGHYFIPEFAGAKGAKGKVNKGPVLTPGKVFDWSLVYDPAANDGNGEMRATLGAESVTLALKPGQKADGASLDRFGLFTSTVGGQMVKIYLDDLQYTAAAAVAAQPAPATPARLTSAPVTMAAFGDVHYYDAQAGLSSHGDTWAGGLLSDGTILLQHDDGKGISDGSYGLRELQNTRLIRLRGVPEDPSTFRGTDYAPGEATPNAITGYHSRPSEFDGVLYTWSMSSFSTKPVLRKSLDRGKTWQDSPNSADILGGKCGWPCFVQYGPGGKAPAVDQADTYVYLFSFNEKTEKGKEWAYREWFRDGLYLMRVKRTDLPSLDATKFEYYKGEPGGDGAAAANWTSDIQQCKSVFNLPGMLGFSYMLYNPAMGRYLYGLSINWNNGVPSNFMVYEAPHPWGPWTKVVGHWFDWGTSPGITHFSLSNAYIRNDGRKIWAFAATDMNTPNYEFHYLPTYFTQSPVTLVEAENATLLGEAKAATERQQFTGDGYATSFLRKGDGARFSLKADKAGYYIVRLRYANTARQEGSVSILINDKKVKRIGFPREHNDWGLWGDHAQVYALRQGENDFEVKRAANDTADGLCIDSAAFAFLQTDDPDMPGTVCPAEQAKLAEGAAIDDKTIANYEGDGVVFLRQPGASTTFTVKVPNAQRAKLFLRYTCGDDEHSETAHVGLSVNGEMLPNLIVGTTRQNRLETMAQKIQLKAGANSMAVRCESPGPAFGLDYIKVVDVENIPAAPELWTLVDDAQKEGLVFNPDWTLIKDNNHWRQSARGTNVKGASMEYRFNGTGVRWIGARYPSHGIAEVYLDGVLEREVDTYAARGAWQQTLFEKTDLPAGTHTLKIVVTDRANAQATGRDADVDRIDVMGKAMVRD